MNDEKNNNDSGLTYDHPRLPLSDDRYRLAGINAFSLSAWSRENEYHAPPRFKEDDELVFINTTCNIERVGQDCDGTTLYNNGWPEYCFHVLPELAEKLKKWAAEDGTETGLLKTLEGDGYYER